MAYDIDMTEANLHRCINKNRIQAGDLEKIARNLNVPINYFFDEEPTGVRIEGDGNQLNGAGAHGNLNGISDSVMAERVRSLEAIVAEKDERIAELKQHIADLKSQN